MRSFLPFAMALTALTTAAAQTVAMPQFPLQAADAVPSPDNDNPSDFLHSAQDLIAAGHVSKAQEALEMAQTRMLDRSVPLGQTNDPSKDATVAQISQARQALADHDLSLCLQLIRVAIFSAAAQGR